MNSYLQRPVVLVIDDDPQVLSQVAAVLNPAGYACECCNTPEAAVRLAHATLPDLIICDMHLDGRSGLEVCDEIKSHAPLRHVPLMFLSATQIPDIIRRSHDAGGAYHLRKPFDASVLIELVGKALWPPPWVENRPRRRHTAAATV
jgi:CheY-like chemotaxis protein